MNPTPSILLKSIVKPFYRQHAGLILFVFILMFGTVGVLHYASFYSFHYSLIQGMLENIPMFLIVLLLWGLYAKKTEQFVVSHFRRPDYHFLQILNEVPTGKAIGWLTALQICLMAPVLFYGMLIIGVGIHSHKYFLSGIVFLFITLLCTGLGVWYRSVLQNPRPAFRNDSWYPSSHVRKIPYWQVLIEYIVRKKKLLLAGMKIYTCGILIAIGRTLTPGNADVRMLFVFFVIGLFGQSVLVYQLRVLEETRMTFYKTLPVPLLKRLAQYGITFFLLLTPEFITLAILADGNISVKDSVWFALFGFSLMMFLNSLLYIKLFRMINFLKIILILFFFTLPFLLSEFLGIVSLLMLIFSAVIFYTRYNLFEQ